MVGLYVLVVSVMFCLACGVIGLFWPRTIQRYYLWVYCGSPLGRRFGRFYPWRRHIQSPSFLITVRLGSVLVLVMTAFIVLYVIVRVLMTS
jgi:hypothetical protein